MSTSAQQSMRGAFAANGWTVDQFGDRRTARRADSTSCQVGAMRTTAHGDDITNFERTSA